ncbi:hypothetical protein Syun_029783 [Stephania yunnanensis]|uniref:Cupin type-1 domain-containing protein n=1 Tax=Stephania yunnanensis TaxID=152371 RepID=A0AAP0HHL3_9MAGN
MSSKLTLLGLFAVAVLFHVGLAQQAGSCPGRQRYGQCQCQIQKLQALRPSQRYESEGGLIEVWLQNNQQLQCAGVTLVRQTIRRNSFNFPGYNNAPKLTYVPPRGRGVHSVVIPGCPETYQSTEQFQGQREQGEQARTIRADEHQKIRPIRQGDVVANPTGHVHWFYNDGEEQLVLIHLIDTGSNSNQLDQQFRKFYLGGNPQSEREHGQHQQGPYQGEEQTYYQQRFESNNIFRGIDDEILQEVLGVRRETVEKVKGRGDVRGHMVQARQGLQLVRPSRMEEEEYRHGGSSSYGNGFEETICTARMRENIGNPARADVYNPEAGYIRTVNRMNLPILNYLQLSAERGVLYRNAIYAPHYNLNAHTIIYVTRGSARVQVIGNYRQPVYDGQLSEGQVLVVPQNFALTKQAGQGGFEWVSFKTDANAMINSLAGKTSAFRALPVDMLASMYQISRQEAENLKYNRGQEVMIFAPSSTSLGRALP